MPNVGDNDCRLDSAYTNTGPLKLPPLFAGSPVAQWVRRWPTDLADRVRSLLETKSSQP